MGCLSENEVVALVESRVDDSARAEILSHLDGCDDCRELVAATAGALMPTADEPSGDEATEASAAIPRVGERVGRYRITARLGSGAMGAVLAAEHVDLRKRVALKVVLPGAGVADEQMRARLVREARAASAIRHPNVIAVHDVLTLEDGSPVMVMDLLEGETLRERLARQGRLTLAETTRLVGQLLSGLSAAHALGVVHRDLKPDNVFISKDGSEQTVKIVDFGIAKLTAVDGPAAKTAGLTHTGMLVGTPHYMAPEQAFAEGPIDPRADLWAVGVILYECLSGRRPFEGDNVGQVLKRLAQLSFRPIDELVERVPPQLSRLIGALLSERELRPGSASEAAEQLAACAGKDEGELPTLIAADVTQPGGVALDDGSWLVRMRRPTPWFAFAGIAAVTLLGYAALVDRQVPMREAGTSLGAEPVVYRAADIPEPTPPASVTVSPSAVPAAPPRRRPDPSPQPVAPEPEASGPGPLLMKPPF